jgi:hypothetical protein
MAADAGENPLIAFFGFSLINTSLEPIKPVEEARLQMLDVLLEQTLGGSGRFRFGKRTSEARRRVAAVEMGRGQLRGNSHRPRLRTGSNTAGSAIGSSINICGPERCPTALSSAGD